MRALAVQSVAGPQVVGALVERTDDRRAAGQSVCERSLKMRALGLRRENLAGMRAKDGDAPPSDRERAAFAFRNLRQGADQDRRS